MTVMGQERPSARRDIPVWHGRGQINERLFILNSSVFATRPYEQLPVPSGGPGRRQI